MEFSVISHPNHLEVCMSGQFTFAYNQKFKQVMDLVEKESLEGLTVNLDAVDFIDSAGLGMLLLLRDRCLEKKITLTLKGARGQVDKILTLSKFGQLFKLVS